MKNDLLPTCDLKISLTINCESTWPGLKVLVLSTVGAHQTIYQHTQ